MVQPTWFERDLPVLRAIVELDEGDDYLWLDRSAIMDRTGFGLFAVERSVKALAHNDQPFFQVDEDNQTGHWEIKNVTGHARRTVGQWPSPKTSVEEQVAALLAAFQQAEEEAPDEASKSKIRAMAETFKGLPAQLAGAVSAAALLKLTGLG